MRIRRKILQRLFGKADGQDTAAQKQVEPRDLSSSPVCAFCGKAATDRWSTIEKEYRLRPQPTYEEIARMHAHTAGLWECTCTAIGSGAWAPDLDEAASLLLEVLGIEFPVNEPCLGHLRRIEWDHVDGQAVLKELLRLHNDELRENAFQQDSNSPPIRCLWVRRRGDDHR